MANANFKLIYGLAKGAQMNDEELHIMVAGLTGKESLKELTDNEIGTVVRELRERMRYTNQAERWKSEGQRSAGNEDVAGMMTEAQIKKAWAIMYKIVSYDTSPRVRQDGTPVAVSERMEGAVKKILDKQVLMSNKKPFRMISFDEGELLIEKLKFYEQSAKRKADAG